MNDIPPSAPDWFVCFNPYKNEPPKFRHLNFDDARAEAERLAIKEGKKIHVLKLVGTAHEPVVSARWQFRGGYAR